MSVFPNLGKLDKDIVNTMKSRSKDLVNTSSLLAWIRVSSAAGDNGLILETVPRETDPDTGKLRNPDFKSEYGGSSRTSGRVGVDFSGQSVIAEGEVRGLRPSPIIDSVSIENGSQGLSRKAKFSIKCFTLAQAEKISEHFLEPGYTVLVEFGWNIASSVNEKLELSPCYMASFNNFRTITRKRKQSGGTYEGFLGFITGGSYASGDDETYIVDVELTTLGEMPTYLQVHKTSINADSNGGKQEQNTSDRFDISNIEDDLDNEKTIGKGLFKLVYNRLPNEKQTRQVKQLLNPNQTDKLGNPWFSEYNFINVDPQTRETFAGALVGFKGKDGVGRKPAETIKIPDGIDIISDQSFIRVELAFTILNLYGINTKSGITPDNKCSEDKTPSYSFEVGWVDTICRGHKYMYSTDITKLFIPNPKSPSFSFDKLLTATESVTVSELINVDELDSEGATINANPWNELGDSTKTEYAFPSQRPFNPSKDQSNRGHDVEDINAPEFSWGYLRNLYINLDFFIEVISRPNFVAKDCYYDLLNGMSAACNSIWKFQILERSVTPLPEYRGEGPLTEAQTIQQKRPFTLNLPEPTDDSESGKPQLYHMEVVDTTFTGMIDIPNDDTKNDSEKKYPIFEPSGVNTPFITSNVIMDIPAVMQNSILGKRSSARQETSLEDQGVEQTKFFATNEDPVMKILNSFNVKGSSDDVIPPPGNQKKPPQEEILAANITSFLERGQILLIERNESVIRDGIFGFGASEKLDLGNNVLIGAYDDGVLLKKVERKYNESLPDSSKNNPIIIPIKFNFEIHGISGIKIGDCFKVNRLPKNMSTGIFQVMETSHELSDGMWKTTVSAQLRNVNGN